MKKVFSILILLLAFTTLLVAQSLQIQNVTNTNSAEECWTDIIHKKRMLQDPVYRQNIESFNLMLKNGQQINKAGGTIYRVPVVVHVMHVGEPVGTGSNISEAAINQAIREVNERWRKVAGTAGDGGGVDMEIEFALAVRDPAGNCTNGIVRVDLSGDANYAANGVRAATANGITDAALKAYSRWPALDYYNIYLITEFDDNECGAGVQGYANLPGGHGGGVDAMVQMACKFAETGNTTLTHELGHAWNLYHTFQGDANGTACPTGTGDFCADTPLHIRYSSHPNFWGAGANCAYADPNACQGGTTTQDHMHNYMDYSHDYCNDEFTADQETRASATMVGTRASYLQSNGNMSLVPPAAAGVDFAASSTAVCLGTPISFYDESTCIPNTYQNGAWAGITFLWTFDNGVNPAITSSLQNPSLTFANPGTYNVTLAVTTGAGTSTVTKNGFVNIAAGSPVAVAACPSGLSQNNGNFWQTINKVEFNTISKTTDSYINTAYSDFTCTDATSVEVGTTYNMSITLRSNGANTEDFEVYIDYNNNGVLDAAEMVMSNSAPGGGLTTFNQNVLIPGTAVLNTMLRMRVVADRNGFATPCDNHFIGETEDYGVYITSSIPQPPVADFSGAPTSSCSAPLTVNFTDLSTGSPAPTSWQWDIDNDGTIDYTTQNPSHTYTVSGNYTVALIATNANGSNTATKVNYVTAGGGAALPIVEDFEGAFPPAGWAITNPDAARTWEKFAASGNGGANAARLDFYNYNSPGQTDDLVSYKIDLNAYSASTLTFDVSYTPFGGTNDQLRVLLSTDCGVTYPNVIYNKMGGALQTTPETGGPALAPTAAGQWRNESIPLTPYVGNPIMLKFESTTQYGNNLFIDNINIVGTPLPVELLSFDAKAKNNKVFLNWITATEINNDYFLIERSVNGENWVTIGKINGSGNSKSTKSYSYIDANPIQGTSYYRLVQYDFNGDNSSSNIEAVNIRKAIEVKPYPNPFHDDLNFDVYSEKNDKVFVEVYNLLGSLVESKTLLLNEGNNSITTKFTNLKQGSYIVKMSNGSTFQKRFKVTKK